MSRKHHYEGRLEQPILSSTDLLRVSISYILSAGWKLVGRVSLFCERAGVVADPMGNPQKHKEIIEVGKPKMQEAKMKTAKDPEMSIDWGDLDDLISPEPMEVDFELIEKTKKAARDPLEDFPDQKISGLGNLKIQVIDEGENDPHAPPD